MNRIFPKYGEIFSLSHDEQEEMGKIFLRTKALSFSFSPPFRLTSGLYSPIYVDNRKILACIEERKILCQHFLNILSSVQKNHRIHAIAGVATAAIPMASWLAWELDLPLVYVRKDAKGYGKKKRVEGEIKKDWQIVVVEDHVSTAKSLVEAKRALEKEGGKVILCLSNTSYDSSLLKEKIKAENLPLYSLVSGSFLLELAQKEGYLSLEEFYMAKEWMENPSSWGEKYGYSF